MGLRFKNGCPVQSNLFDFDIFMEEINHETKMESGYVISFDVFDTLLKRGLLNQENTWKESSIYFFFWRFTSEKIARHLHKRFKSREVTLKQIYRFMPKRYKIVDELKREKASIKIDPIIERTILELQNRKQRLILISDTYYTKEDIRYFLQGAKFDVGLLEIVTSSEHRISKCKGLFTEIQKSSSLEFQNWTHIGDDLQADYLVPNSLGIITLLYVNHINEFLKSKILSPKGMRRLEKIKGPTFIYNLSVVFQKVQKEISSDHLDFVSTIIIRPLVKHLTVIIDKSETMRGSELILYCSRDGWLFYNSHVMLKRKNASSLRLEYFKTSRSLRNHPEYRKYVDEITNVNQTIGVFDLGWKGSTLAYLNKISPAITWRGYFFTSTYSGDAEFENLATFSLLERVNILRSREFLELLFPAPTASYSKIDLNGVPEPAHFGEMASQIDVDKICFNVLSREVDFKELDFADAVTLIYLLAVYPGSACIERMSKFNFDSSGEIFIPLVTNDWSKLLSRNKILWPFSAQPNFPLVIRVFFRTACIIKEILQKIPYAKNIFIG